MLCRSHWNHRQNRLWLMWVQWNVNLPLPDANMMHVESEAILGEVISVNLAERSSQFGGGLIPEEAVSAPAAYTFPADSRSSQD